MRGIGIISFLLAISFLLPGVCFSQEGYEELSKIGFVKNNGANVRAGDNVNFTSLCQLDEGDPVKVIGKRYSWYKVALPRSAYLYIKSDFVDLLSEKGEAEVNAGRVNLRAGPGTKYAILGQVSKPERVHVVLEEDGWYKIIPPEGIGGWVHESQLRFSMENTPLKPEKEESQSQAKEKKETGIKLMLKQTKPHGNLTFSTQDK